MSKTLLFEEEVTFPKQQILDSSKLKEFAEDSLELDENGRKFSKRVENSVGKGEIAHLGSSKLKEFAEDSLELDENGRKFSKQVENSVGKEKLII